jgi:hypothetical protein
MEGVRNGDISLFQRFYAKEFKRGIRYGGMRDRIWPVDDELAA